MSPSLREVLETMHGALTAGSLPQNDLIRETEELDGLDLLAIYRSSYLGIQTDALATVYPVVQALTGEDFFRAMAKSYLRDFPSTSGDLHELGDQLPNFIENFPPAESLPYLADTARLEWAWHRCFHAADRVTFNFTALASLTPATQATTVFQLSPDVNLLQSDYPVQLIWEANQPVHDGEVCLDTDQERHHLVIYREGYNVCMSLLDARIWQFLEAVQMGQSITTLGEKHDIPTLLPNAIEQGWIDRFAPPSG